MTVLEKCLSLLDDAFAVRTIDAYATCEQYGMHDSNARCILNKHIAQTSSTSFVCVSILCFSFALTLAVRSFAECIPVALHMQLVCDVLLKKSTLLSGRWYSEQNVHESMSIEQQIQFDFYFPIVTNVIVILTHTLAEALNMNS